jgi:small subunit ribosomal protein S6
MNKYESVFIINPSVEDAGVKTLIQKFSDLINSDGKVESVDELGKKKLAYEIKKNTEGNYVVLNFEANPAVVAELERIYRITDEVMKFITIRKDEE